MRAELVRRDAHQRGNAGSGGTNNFVARIGASPLGCGMGDILTYEETTTTRNTLAIRLPMPSMNRK